MPVAASVFRVGDWIVTPRRCTLEKDGRTVHVRPKSMAVLKCLADANGEVVTRNELFDRVWSNIAVTDDVLTQCIVELRKGVGDSAQDPQFIETVPKVGFRLVAPVSTVADARRVKTRTWIAIGTMVTVAVLAFAYVEWFDDEPGIRTIAVLPLASLSDDPEQAYFAYGVTDLLTAELGQITGLGVISRTSADLFKDSGKSLPQIGRELGADALIEGSVQADDDEVLINLQLIDVRTDRHLWSRPFRRSVQDLITLQGELTRTIADEIAATLTPQIEERMDRDRETNPEAVRLWMIGVMQMQDTNRPEGLAMAVKNFEKAVELDPGFAKGYSSMATAYVYQGSFMGKEDPNVVLPLAISSAHTALELDPYLADAHYALGSIHRLNWQWEVAERQYRKAYELNPSNTLGLLEYANLLTAMGRYDEAIEKARMAVRFDPLNPLTYNELAFAHWGAGQLDETQVWFEQSLEIDPNFRQTMLLLPDFYIQLDEPDKALVYLDKVRQDPDDYLSTDIGYVAGSYVVLGRDDLARELLEYLLDKRKTGNVKAYPVAQIYNALGEEDTALDWLELAIEERNASVIWLKEDTWFDNLRGNPRYEALLERIEFPE